MRERDRAGRGDRTVSRLQHVGVGINFCELRALEHSVEERRDLGTAPGSRAVVVLAADLLRALQGDLPLADSAASLGGQRAPQGVAGSSTGEAPEEQAHCRDGFHDRAELDG